jgi:hypothetical protein
MIANTLIALARKPVRNFFIAYAAIGLAYAISYLALYGLPGR